VVFLALTPDSGQKNKNTAKKGFKMGDLGSFSSRANFFKFIDYRLLHSKKGQSFFVSRHLQGGWVSQKANKLTQNIVINTLTIKSA
jgi:hypothetical protein